MGSSALAETLCVAPEQVDDFWPFVSGWLRSATDRCGDWTLEDVRAALDNRQALLWILWDGSAIKAAAVSQLSTVPRGKICTILACGGGASGSWGAALLPIEQYAREQGCVASRIQGRPAWARVFHDYKTEWVTIEKVLR